MPILSEPGYYPFHFIMREPGDNAGILFVHKYKFKLDGNRSKRAYIVEFFEFKRNVFVIKFYPKRLRNSKNKYKVMTGDYKARKIISTCMLIAVHMYKKYPKATFAFIGQNSEGEKISNTKRYRVYSYMSAFFVNPDIFEHMTSVDISAYILLNKNNEETTIETLPLIQKEFQEMYDINSIFE